MKKGTKVKLSKKYIEWTMAHLFEIFVGPKGLIDHKYKKAVEGWTKAYFSKEPLVGVILGQNKDTGCYNVKFKHDDAWCNGKDLTRVRK